MFARDAFLCRQRRGRNCETKVGAGNCLDKDGNEYNRCFSNISLSACKETAKDTANVIGLQFKYSRGFLDFSFCYILFDAASEVICPDGFDGFFLPDKTGTGPIVDSNGEESRECFVCEN